MVTVLFADVVGFTSRSESLDIEDVGAFLEPFHRIAADEVTRHGGTVAKFIGDGVMAVFGAPTASEDDPERAVRAALEIQRRLESLRVERPLLELHVRVGITTGQVLLRFDEVGGVDGVGDAVNTAARLESAAPIDAVLVGDRTRRSTVGRIEYGEVISVQAKGKSRPLLAAVALRAGREDGDANAGRFVGRAAERSLLSSLFDEACDTATAATVLVVGAPGAGKSRLVHELRRYVERRAEPAWWRKGRSAPFLGGAALWPLAEILKLHAEVLDEDTAGEASQKLAGAIAGLVEDVDEAAWLSRALGPLLGVRPPGDAPIGQSETLAAWRTFARALPARRPTVLLFEDLHWADDATLDLVQNLAAETGLPLLVLATGRPELLDRWSEPGASATVIRLEPLSAGETGDLAAELLGGDLSTELRELLAERAAGNPLFAQEDARMLMDSGLLVSRDGRWTIDAPSALELPDTVQGIIGARLDRLTPESRSLISDAAVVAAGLGVDVLAHMSDTPPDIVSERLAALERAGLLRPSLDPTTVGGRFAFTHVLIRDVAYERLVRRQRASRHERAAAWFEHLQEGRDQLLEVVADHYLKALEYREAGGEDCSSLIARARGPIRDAGRRAASLGAYSTALRLLERAAAMWPHPDAARGEVLLAYGEAQLGAGLEGEQALREAVELLAVAGSRERLADAQLNLSVVLYHHGDVEGAGEALASAYQAVHEAPPSRTKTTVLGLVARVTLERGDGKAALRLAMSAASAAAADSTIPPDVVAYAQRQVGLAQIALGDSSGLSCISDPIPELDRLRLSPAAAAHRSDLAGTLMELGRLEETAVTVAELLDTQRSGWAQITEQDVAAIREALWYWSGEWDRARAAANLDWNLSPQMVVPQAWPVALIALARGDTALAGDVSLKALLAARTDRDVWCRITAAVVRARIVLEHDREQAADLLAEAADLWEHTTPIHGVMIPTAADVYLRLGIAGEGERRISSMRMASMWRDASLLALAGDPAAAARCYRQIGSLPDAAAALEHAGLPAEAAAIWRKLGATSRLAGLERAGMIDGASAM